MSVSEIINISRMINGRSMKFSQNLSNRYIIKGTKSGTRTFIILEVLKVFRARMTSPPPLRLIGLKTEDLANAALC